MNRIVIFAKSPTPGHAKTRLAPLLGIHGAAELARQMLIRTCREARHVRGAIVELCVAPAPGQPLWSGPWPEGVEALSNQGEGDLGERLSRAAERVIALGGRIVLIGTDCPDLDRQHLQNAFSVLETFDAFLHPVEDGGYALLALRRYSPFVFAGIEWSGPKVAQATLERLEALEWSAEIGETLRDIDDARDFQSYFGRRTLAPR